MSRLIEGERGTTYYGYETLPVHCVTEMKKLHEHRPIWFLAYGNQAVFSHLYLEACLVVIIGSVEDRKAVSQKLKG